MPCKTKKRLKKMRPSPILGAAIFKGTALWTFFLLNVSFILEFFRFLELFPFYLYRNLSITRLFYTLSV